MPLTSTCVLDKISGYVENLNLRVTLVNVNVLRNNVPDSFIGNAGYKVAKTDTDGEIAIHRVCLNIINSLT